MYVYILFVILVITIFHVITRYIRSGRLVNKLPGYKPVQIFGNLIHFHTTGARSKLKQRRKILTPAFQFNVLKKYLEIINDHGQKCILNLKKEGREITRNLVKFSSNFTLDIICEPAMGVSLEINENINIDVYKKAIYDFCYVVVSNRRDYRNRTGHLEKFFNELNHFEDDIGCKKRLAMLDLLLAAEQNNLIDDAGIKEEVDTFIFEGHDTTAMGLTFCLLLLAKNEKAQNLARNEIKAVLNKSGGQKFAIIELKAALTYILNHFYLEPIDRSSHIELIADIVIRPQNLVTMKFFQIDQF